MIASVSTSAPNFHALPLNFIEGPLFFLRRTARMVRMTQIRHTIRVIRVHICFPLCPLLQISLNVFFSVFTVAPVAKYFISVLPAYQFFQALQTQPRSPDWTDILRFWDRPSCRQSSGSSWQWRARLQREFPYDPRDKDRRSAC